MEGKALIFSAPSGSGKTTIVHHLMKVFPELQFSISATTRSPRYNELDGKDYHFLSEEEFHKSKFIESEEVYNSVFYGTLVSEVEKIWKAGKVVVFDVDVKGGVNLKKYFGKNGLSVFVKVPDVETIKQRLTARNTDSSESLESRFSRIDYEMTFEDQFEYVLVNDKLNNTLLEAEKLVSEFLNS